MSFCCAFRRYSHLTKSRGAFTKQRTAEPVGTLRSIFSPVRQYLDGSLNAMCGSKQSCLRNNDCHDSGRLHRPTDHYLLIPQQVVITTYVNTEGAISLYFGHVHDSGSRSLVWRTRAFVVHDAGLSLLRRACKH